MKFLSIGGGKAIGANCHFLEIDRTGIILDAGIDPHHEGQQSLPSLDLIRDRLVDALFVSHGHHDHLGALPVVLKRFPHARVFLTYPSSYLYTTMLHNTVTVMTALRLEKNIPEYPLYTHEDVDMISYIIQGMKFHKDFRVFGHDNSQEGLRCRWLPAGHTLGAGGLYIASREGRLFYTGDTSATDQFLIRGAEYPREPVDILIMECTMAGNAEAEHVRRKNEVRKLARIIEETADRRGCVLIPAFALGKTQEMLWLVHQMKQKKQIPSVDLYVSGLGRAVSRIYDLSAEYSHRVDETVFFDDMEFDVMESREADRAGWWFKRPSVIIASSGMMMENTPSYRLARRMLGDERHTICFVGYTSPDAPARRIYDSKPGEELTCYPEPIRRACRIERLQFSGHSDRQDLLRMVRDLHPKKIVMVHSGSDEALTWMRTAIQEWNPTVEVILPEVGTEYHL